jgi:hypothetical protein
MQLMSCKLITRWLNTVQPLRTDTVYCPCLGVAMDIVTGLTKLDVKPLPAPVGPRQLYVTALVAAMLSDTGAVLHTLTVFWALGKVLLNCKLVMLGATLGLTTTEVVSTTEPQAPTTVTL